MRARGPARPCEPARAPARAVPVLACLSFACLSFALLSLGACPQDQPADPLDPHALAELAKDGGDAEGDALSGRYAVAGAPAACDCPERMGVDLCAPEFAALTGLTGLVEVTQVDGFMTWIPVAGGATLGMSGALDRDGAFVLAGLYDLGSLLSTGDIYARLEGAFAGDRSITGAVDYRLLGELADGPVDCRVRFTITGAPAPPT